MPTPLSQLLVGSACSAVLLVGQLPLVAADAAGEGLCRQQAGAAAECISAAAAPAQRGSLAVASESVLLQVQHHAQQGASGSLHAQETQSSESGTEEDKINVCYFTNWARYRTGLVNSGKDVFEMDFPGELCSHFMYGFATVTADFQIKSNDPNADHPSGSESQDGLCNDACNDPSYTTNWNDPNSVRCDWPCNPTRVMRGYEAATVGMKLKNPNVKSLISVGGWNFNDCSASSEATWVKARPRARSSPTSPRARQTSVRSLKMSSSSAASGALTASTWTGSIQ